MICARSRGHVFPSNLANESDTEVSGDLPRSRGRVARPRLDEAAWRGREDIVLVGGRARTRG